MWPEHFLSGGFQIADAEHQALPLSEGNLRRLPEIPENPARNGSRCCIRSPIAMRLTQSLRQIAARVQDPTGLKPLRTIEEETGRWRVAADVVAG